MNQPIDPQIEAIYADIATYQAIALEAYGVPQWQALPIASKPEIAFRPSCSQLRAVWQADGSTAWAWQGHTLYTTPEHMQPTPETLLNLQGAGVCVTGSHAVEVPIVPTDEVFQEFQQVTGGAVAVLPDAPVTTEQSPESFQATATPQVEPAGINFGALIPIAIAVVVIGLMGRFLAEKQSAKNRQNRSFEPAAQPQQTPPQATELEDEYDFQL